MIGYSDTEISLPSAAATTGIVTDKVVSRIHRISALGARGHLVVKITTTGVTKVGTLTFKLQTALGNDWVDSKTTTITAAGDVYIKLLDVITADQTYLPLLNQMRVVVSTTNAGDILTVSSITVVMPT